MTYRRITQGGADKCIKAHRLRRVVLTVKDQIKAEAIERFERVIALASPFSPMHSGSFPRCHYWVKGEMR
jgi:hypothetical protein